MGKAILKNNIDIYLGWHRSLIMGLLFWALSSTAARYDERETNILSYHGNSQNVLAQKLRKPHVENRVLVKRKPVVKNFLKGIKAYLKAAKVAEFKNLKLEVLDFGREHSMAEALFLYGQDPSVEYVEPDYLVHATDFVPDDALFSLQWGLSTDSEVHINAPLLWQSTTGDDSIIVAVIDTGVNFLHSDLAANMWQNPGEVPDNDIDDDLNGYVDDVYGINTDPANESPLDDNGHGSHVAGVIAATGNNSLGVAGVMHRAKIIACKFLDKQGNGTTSDAIKCLDYLFNLKTRSNMPINIVASNNSWATNIFSDSLYDAIKLQGDANIAFVAAADNYGLNNDLFDTYPANFELGNVISVAAIDQGGRIAKFSNFGRHSVHVAAPGVQIQSTVLGNFYGTMDGTSMAAPFVTGLLGILSHYFPDHTTVQNRNLVIASQKRISHLKKFTLGAGIIRGADDEGVGAISCHNQRIFQTILPKLDLVSYPVNEPVNVRVLNLNCANPGGEFEAHLDFSETSIDFHDDGESGDLAASDGVYSATFTPSITASHKLDIAHELTLDLEVYDSSKWASYRMVQDQNFTYINIGGTRIDFADDDVYGLKLPFKVPFANDPVGLSHVYIGSNGTLSLSDHKLLDFVNAELPIEGFSTLLAPLWLDLDPALAKSNEGVFYEIIGTEPQRQLVVEWRNVKHHKADGKVTFQVVLREDSPQIVYSYHHLNFNDLDLEGGQGATIGIQVLDKAATLPLDASSIADNSTFILAPNSPPVAHAGFDKTVQVADSIHLDGSHSFDLENVAMLHYSWSQVSGPKLVISEPKNAKTTVLAEEPGIAVLSLKVTDDGGDYSRDELIVTITSKSNASRHKKGSGGQKKARKPLDLGPKSAHVITKDIVINTAPEAPRILEPKAEFFIDKAPRNLVAQNGIDRENDLLTYEVEIYTQADFSNLVYAQRSLSSKDGAFVVLTLPPLSPTNTYFWRVRAFDGKLFSPWSLGQFRFISEALKPVVTQDTTAAGCSTMPASTSGWLGLVFLLLMRKRRKINTRTYLQSSKM